MDARSRRSRESLWSAVLELAARVPIDDVTASAICREAGVTRDTFYRHADSPVGLLADALGAELEALTAAALDGMTMGTAERLLLEHVRGRAAVYRGAMHPLLAAPVRGNLERILRDGLLQYADLHPEILPARVAGSPPALRIACAYAAAGTVGAIEEWLRSSDDDLDRAVEIILAASPEWWLRGSPPDSRPGARADEEKENR